MITLINIPDTGEFVSLSLFCCRRFLNIFRRFIVGGFRAVSAEAVETDDAESEDE